MLWQRHSTRYNSRLTHWRRPQLQHLHNSPSTTPALSSRFAKTEPTNPPSKAPAIVLSSAAREIDSISTKTRAWITGKTVVCVSEGEGNESSDFTIHRSFATKSFEVFEIALSASDEYEACEKRMPLPEAEPVDFEAYLGRLHGHSHNPVRNHWALSLKG